MSELSDIRYKINEQQRLNRELNKELGAIINGIQNAYNKWNNLCNNISNTLNNGVMRVNASQSAIEASYELQSEIDEMYVLFKNIELANKKIRECNNKMIYDFANYSAVRKIVSAMLDNVEISFVSDATIAKTVEIKHLQLPDYWLTCALLSIMAWKNNDKALANQALERACKLDKKETAVFFLAFNLRIGRESAAVKWFEYYRSCDLSGEDDKTFLLLFSIVSKALINDYSDETISKIREYINEVINENISQNGYDEAYIVSRIGSYLKRFIPNDTIGYTVLMKHCVERDALVAEMMLAKANINILDFILKTMNVSDNDRNDYLNEFIESTVKKPNKVELEVEDEIQYNELIIKHQGNIEAAQNAFNEIKAHRENEFDIMIEMIDWIYKTNQDDVNPMVKANMMRITKDLNQKSINDHIDRYRKSFRTTYQIQINDYQASANLTDESGECQKLKAFIENKKQNALSTVKTWISIIGFVAAVLSFVGAIAVPAPSLFVFTVVGIAFGIIYLLTCNAKKASIIRDCDNEYVVNETILKSIISEFKDYTNEYKEYDSYAEKIEYEFQQM